VFASEDRNRHAGLDVAPDGATELIVATVIQEQGARSDKSMLLKNLAAIVVTLIVTLLVGSQGDHITVPDSANYRLIAYGHIEQAAKPFANRVLHANVVRVVANWTGLSPDAAFPIAGAASLALFIPICALLLQPGWGPWAPWLCIALLCEPWVAALFQLYYFPDLLHAALVGVFFYLLTFYPRWAWPVLFLLTLTREATVLLSISVVAVYLLFGRRRLAIEAALVFLLGVLCQARLASNSLPNVHGINNLIYMLCKIPNNLLANIFGLKFAYNTYSYYATTHPIAVIDLPHWGFLHNLRQAALVEIDYKAPLQTLLAYLTVFGIAPVLLYCGFRRQVRTLRDILGFPAVVLVAVCYGALSILVAPTLGNDVPRYLSYAWPVFVVAGSHFVKLPFLFSERMALFACQLILCWVTSVSPLLPAIAVAIALHYVAFRISRRTEHPLPDGRGSACFTEPRM
jgi:hypothetical protein